MISTETNKDETIDTLIRQNRSFAIYRIPGETHSRFVMQASGTVRLLYNMEELNEQQGFVIAPFRISRTCPVVLIRRDYAELPDIDPADNIHTDNAYNPIEMEQPLGLKAKDRYTHRFNTFIQPLLGKQLDKLVLSRSLILDRKADFSPAKAFYKACKQYLHSYVYLFHTPVTGTWLGGTPEVLLAGEKNEWHTVALAGTQSLQQIDRPDCWDNKNKQEQQLVSLYIHDQLRSLGIASEMKGPYPARAGGLCHLKSDFRFRLNSSNKLGSLLKLLHPTPAVCGLPKEAAYRFILDNEGYDRRYYSGFIGWLHPEEKTDLYVNLRCMHIAPKTQTLYAGGGLLPSSVLNDEWQETEDKLETMRALL